MINHIIVKNEKDIPQLIEFIMNSSVIGGSGNPLSMDDKYYLINHIISFERIRRDF